MSEVEQLEQQIERLSEQELAEFRAWFAEFDARVWDAEIEADSQAGRLDFLVREAREEKAKGTLKEM